MAPPYPGMHPLAVRVAFTASSICIEGFVPINAMRACPPCAGLLPQVAHLPPFQKGFKKGQGNFRRK